MFRTQISGARPKSIFDANHLRVLGSAPWARLPWLNTMVFNTSSLLDGIPSTKEDVLNTMDITIDERRDYTG